MVTETNIALFRDRASGGVVQVYAQWQVRINYFHWKKLKALEGAGSPVGGYTRLLHSGRPDELMAEIPTVVVNPLPPDVPDGVRLRPPAHSGKWHPSRVRSHLHCRDGFASSRDVEGG